MKRTLIPVAQILLLSFFACQENVPHLAPSPVVADAKAGFVIMPDLPFFSLNGTSLVQNGTTTLGEKLTLTGQSAQVSQSGRQRELLQVKRESGSEGWVRADFVVSRSILAVVISDDAMIYSAPDDAAATTASVPRLTVLAIHSDTAGTRFIRVTAFDPQEKVLLRSVWLRNDCTSSNPQDIEAAILLQLAQGSTNLKQQEAFLSSAIKDNPDNMFMSDLEAALAALATPSAPPPASPASGAAATTDQGGSETPSPTVAVTGTMVATDDSVSVYDSPDQTLGAVVGVLAKGQVVEIVKKTAGKFTMGDLRAPWYRIRDPSGWVFGASLAPSQ